MRSMRWSWRDLEETPVYVRRYCLDFLGLVALAEQQARERAQA